MSGVRVERPLRSRASLFAGAAALLLVATGCKSPTQATIEIVSEIAYRSDTTVAVQLDDEGHVETAAPRVVTREGWGEGGVVGTVAALPSDGDTFVARVVLAVGRDPASCSIADARGCIVVRRRVRFVRGDETRVRVVLRPACLGVYCDAATTCGRDGTCGPLDSDDGGGDAGSPPLPDGGDPYAAAVLADRPRHYYRLDEPAGATIAKDTMGRADGVYDRVGLGVTGALRTSPATGAQFDGLGGSLVVDRPDDLSGAASFEAWVRSDAPDDAASPTILERVDQLGEGPFGYRLSRPTGTSAVFEIFRGGSSALASAPPIRFPFAGYTHVAAVMRGGKIEIFIDGKSLATSTYEDPASAPVLAPLVVGASRGGAGPWRGAIDEIAIYDYPLAVEQLRNHRMAAGADP